MKNFFIILLLLSGITAHATHNRAGEITLIQLDDFTYQIEIATFTYTLSAADRNELDVQWGDNTISVAKRYQKTTLPNYYYHNKYTAIHTFPGPGTYTIVVQDPNRNLGVENIPNSVNVIFSISTTIAINPSIGPNNTPVLLNPPIDRAALGRIFIHNPAAYDPDGDSLSYDLTICTEEDGKPIEDYEFPASSDTLFIDPTSGDLTWNTPVDTGIYNIAIKISEWRNGIRIGAINRDMQIEVYRTDNNPPVNMPLPDFCVEAGTFIDFEIISLDEDSDFIVQSAKGGPFEQVVSPASFEEISSEAGRCVSRFTWLTNCEHAQNQPYSIIVKAEDQFTNLNLVDIDNFTIKVISPAPENLQTNPTSTTIRLSWNTCQCTQTVGYRIFRREKSIGFIPDSCVNGVPPYTGYVEIGNTSGYTDTTFEDMGSGTSLTLGNEYCYLVVGVYEDGTLSYASEEICDVLIPGTPAVINASVTSVGPADTVFLAWAKPAELDTLPGPFEYIIYRSDDLMGINLVEIYSFITTDLNDTTYIDSPLNTEIFPYSYLVELYHDEPFNRFRIGKQEIASTIYLDLVPDDNRLGINIMKNVPWINDQYVIYRQNHNTLKFDSIGITTEEVYIDSGLVNGTTYCYQVRSIGHRPVSGKEYRIENFSHVNCGMPVDRTPPCPPDLNVNSWCDSLYNELIWTNPNNYCVDDVVKYRIYYSPALDNPPGLIDSTMSATDTTFLHFPPSSLAGCYRVTAVDSFNNESDFSELVCVDNCIDYVLPNVFTPNGDGINDYWKPGPYSFVERVDMKVYNRWGGLVFQTEDPDINWNGRFRNTNKLVTPGVYYYIADVYENRLTGLEVRNLVGFVYVLTEKGAKNPPIE
ncbi:MAG: gliding motility-associated C-terminal domain-containing protein [Bacteroidales bacterium]|nr:gliding motility-associated C-terminal domain-containing protein [Bacteroidales bacterium]